jgi:nicotinate-nucleotide pyrophosphorylase (carboxylating)
LQNLQTFLDVREMLAAFLREDIGTGDITSQSIIAGELEAKAEIICKTNTIAVICGLEEATIIFDICGCKAQSLVKDGSYVKKGKQVMTITGKARDILKAERVALNLIMRMSGIATETRHLANSAKGVQVLATRKTAPGLRYFDKKAVVVGGGRAHRMRLDDMVLIKDNHLALSGSVTESIRLAKKNVGSTIKVECEAKNTKEALDAILAGADIIMLDNFTPRQASAAIKQIEKKGLRNKVKIEISGGVNSKNIGQYAKAKPDFVSLGYITHSVKATDFSLEII